MDVEDGVSRKTASATTLDEVGLGSGVDEVEGAGVGVDGISVVEGAGASEVGAGAGIVDEGTGSVTRTALPSMVIVPMALAAPVA